MLLTINCKLIYTHYGEGSNGDLAYIYRMQHQHATATTTDQIGAAHHDTAINVTCVRGHYFLYKHSHHASCSNCCIVLCCLHLGGDDGGCSCMLLLHPVPTSADAGPDLCTLHPDLCTLCLWCFTWCKQTTCTGGGCHQLHVVLVVLFHCATTPLAHVVVYITLWNLHLRCFLIQLLVQILHSRLGNLHCVEVVCGGGSCMWRWRYIHMKSVLTLDKLALCDGSLRW